MIAGPEMTWNIPRDDCYFPYGISIRVSNGAIPSQEEITFELATDPKNYLRTGAGTSIDTAMPVTSIGLGRDAACQGVTDWKSPGPIVDDAFSGNRTVNCVFNPGVPA